MRKLKHLFMLCLFGMISIGAKAEVYSGPCGDNVQWSLDTEYGILAITGSGGMTNYSKGTAPWYNYRESITSINIGNQITSIGDGAFYNCAGITTLNLPNSVQSIGYNAFQKCSLTSINIPNSVTSLGKYSFADNNNLSSVTFEDGDQTLNVVYWSFDSGISEGPFGQNFNISKVYIGRNITWGRYSPFKIYGTGSDNIQEIEIGPNVTNINGLFPCSKDVKSIISYAQTPPTGSFNNELYTKNLVITVPRGCKEQYASATDWSSFQYFVYPDEIINGSCGENTEWTLDIAKREINFHGIGSISNVTWKPYQYYIRHLVISEGITSTLYSSFENYKYLLSVDVPSTLVEMGDLSFYGCNNLNKVNIADIDRWAEIKFGGTNGQLTNPLQYAKKLYLKDELVTEVCISKASKINDYAFQNCESIEKIELSGEVKSIGKQSFCYCTNINSIKLNDGLESIGSYAFSACDNIKTDLKLPKSLTEIKSYAFVGCSLNKIYVSWDQAKDVPIILDSWTFPFSKCDLYVPSGCIELYASLDNWNTFRNIYEYTDNVEIVNTNNTIDKTMIISGSDFDLYDDIKSVSISESINNVNVTYTRNFDKAGVWQAWYMPFDVAFDDMKDAYDVAQIHGVLLDKDNNAVIAFLKLDDGTVKANTPYVVRPKASGEVSIETTTDLQPTVSKSFDLKSATDIYYLGGVYEKTTTPGNWYALNLDGQFQLMGSGVYLRPFRIYMTIDPRDDNPYATSANANAKMDIVVLGDDGEATGINLTPALSQGEGVIYNLNGQRVTSITSGKIYIMNGKKYIAK